jgi:predicted dehydrogenase
VSARAPLRVALVGCGNIAGKYARDIVAKPQLRLVGATDLDRDRAVGITEAHGGRVFDTLDELLASDVELVVNLTVQAEHARITRAALEAGKHVHSEKPLALTPHEAWQLVDLARTRGVRLGCSPFTLLGAAQQTAWKLIRDGRIGPVRVVFSQVDWGRIERWHPAPQPFYEVGPVSDVGVYPLSIVTAILGPVRRVRAFGRVLAPDRTTLGGAPYTITTPDLWIVILELEGGAVMRLTASFYAGTPSKGPAAIAFHGDAGSVWLETFMALDHAVEIARQGEDESYSVVPLLGGPEVSMDWARAVADMADAIAEGRPHRATGEQAAHIVDVLAATTESAARDGAPVDVTSSFPVPAPMPWAE